mmetsp:Transcript_61388/g.163275  ORF Transcript_61388/g.163275 Transcript_61388/m.163275 type:complete len:105 (-) Transcript_61388:1336-1650(-)
MSDLHPEHARLYVSRTHRNVKGPLRDQQCHPSDRQCHLQDRQGPELAHLNLDLLQPLHHQQFDRLARAVVAVAEDRWKMWACEVAGSKGRQKREPRRRGVGETL